VDSTFVGLNATSQMIEVAIRPTGELWKTDFADESITETATKLKCMEPKLVVMEGAGNCESPKCSGLCPRSGKNQPPGFHSCGTARALR